MGGVRCEVSKVAGKLLRILTYCVTECAAENIIIVYLVFLWLCITVGYLKIIALLSNSAGYSPRVVFT